MSLFVFILSVLLLLFFSVVLLLFYAFQCSHTRDLFALIFSIHLYLLCMLMTLRLIPILYFEPYNKKEICGRPLLDLRSITRYFGTRTYCQLQAFSILFSDPHKVFMQLVPWNLILYLPPYVCITIGFIMLS